MGTAIIDWVKTHLTVVVCSTLGLVSVAMLILGVLDKDVSADMGRDARLYQDLRSLKPANQKMIEDAKTELRRNLKRFEEATTKLEKRSEHRPLIDGLFPKMSLTAPFDFQEAYGRKQQELLGLLRALDRPSQEEIEKEQSYLDTAEERAETERGLGAGGTNRPAAGFGFNRPAAGTARPRSTDGQTLDERRETDAELRVSIRRAREIYCYASPASLDNRTDPRASEKPSQEAMWYAQMSLWVQEDVIRALAQLNEDTASAIQENGGQPWVGNLPVKHLLKIAVGDYVPPAVGTMRGSGDALGGSKELMPPGDASMVFTGQGSTADVDVIQFGIDLVAEAARLPALIDAISGAGFYTCLLVNYEVIPPNLEMVGYIYGNNPVVNVQLQFEGCFMQSEFAKLMPESVRTAIQNGEARMEGGGSGGGDRPTPGLPGGGGAPRQPRRGGSPIAS